MLAAASDPTHLARVPARPADFNAEQNPGSETAEADDQELLENLWKVSEEIITEVTGGEGLGPWKA